MESGSPDIHRAAAARSDRAVARLPYVEALRCWCQNRMYELGPAGRSLVRSRSADLEVGDRPDVGCPRGRRQPAHAKRPRAARAEVETLMITFYVLAAVASLGALWL